MCEPSLHGDLAGKPWSAAKDWEVGPSALEARGDPGEARGDPGEAVTGPWEAGAKLPMGHMDSLGRCPTWDSVTLVNCNICSSNVRIEVFEDHVSLWHGAGGRGYL